MSEDPNDDGNPFPLVPQTAQEITVAVQTAMSREQHTLQAILTVAAFHDRNERVSFDRAMTACERPTLAKVAMYSFPRGKKKDAKGNWVDNLITGPSVRLARELARCWGSIQIECPMIVEITEDEIHIRGVGLDLVSLNRIAMEDRFRALVQRRVGRGPDAKTEWVVPDERDRRELVNRHAAMLERNIALKLLPADVVQEAVARVGRTLLKAADDSLGSKEKKETALKELEDEFRAVGVTRTMLEENIGRKWTDITPTQYANLQTIRQSILDGNSRISDHFVLPASKRDGDDLTERLKAEQQGQEQEKAKAEPKAEPQTKPTPPRKPPETPLQGPTAPSATSTPTPEPKANPGEASEPQGDPVFGEGQGAAEDEAPGPETGQEPSEDEPFAAEEEQAQDEDTPEDDQTERRNAAQAVANGKNKNQLMVDIWPLEKAAFGADATAQLKARIKHLRADDLNKAHVADLRRYHVALTLGEV